LRLFRRRIAKGEWMNILPEGWGIEPYGPDHEILKAKDSKGFITVDLKRRCFRLGIARAVGTSASGGKKYSGRGWKEDLYKDAISTLQEAITC
jgi:hypothetical protein